MSNNKNNKYCIGQVSIDIDNINELKKKRILKDLNMLGVCYCEICEKLFYAEEVLGIIKNRTTETGVVTEESDKFICIKCFEEQYEGSRKG